MIFTCSAVKIPLLLIGKILLVFLLMYVFTLLTPKIAAKIDKAAEKEKQKKENEDPRLYSVKSAFEPHDDDEPPNKTLFPEIEENKINRNEETINGQK